MPVAIELLEFIKPYCDKSEIGGSLRRRKEFVGDIELVIQVKENMYNKLFNKLGMHLLRSVRDFKYLKNGDRYKQFYYKGIKVDLFIAQPDNWGLIFAIRTGSAEYAHHILATGWVKKGFNSVDGFLTRNGEIVPVKEETELFKLIGVDYIPPTKRELQK